MTVESSADNILQTNFSSSNTVDQKLITTLPTLSPDSGLNDAIIYTTPGVAADSNGFFHPLGDHAQVSYVIDGQPIGDQRNKAIFHFDPRECYPIDGSNLRFSPG